MASEVSDLPHPDSPTMHRVSPLSTWKLMLWTACKIPPGTGISIVRFLTSRMRAVIVFPPYPSVSIFGSRNVTDTIAKKVDAENHGKKRKPW